jgi:hypothetical protein
MSIGTEREMKTHSRQRWVAIVVLAALALATVGCGDDRSVESFCSTMRSEKERILGKLGNVKDAAAQSGDDFTAGLITLGGSLSVLGELRTYFAKLDAVAPEEIAQQVTIVRKAIDDQFDAAGDAVTDPLGGLASGLVSSLTSAGQLDDVNSWAISNCGEGI